MIKANLLSSTQLAEMRKGVMRLQHFAANPPFEMNRTELQLVDHIKTLSGMVLNLTEPVSGQDHAGK